MRQRNVMLAHTNQKEKCGCANTFRQVNLEQIKECQYLKYVQKENYVLLKVSLNLGLALKDFSVEKAQMCYQMIKFFHRAHSNIVVGNLPILIWKKQMALNRLMIQVMDDSIIHRNQVILMEKIIKTHRKNKL